MIFQRPLNMLRKIKLATDILMDTRKGRYLTVLPDDIFIVSYPKSGNTWMRFLIGNLLFQDEPITFSNIELKVPDIYRNNNRKLLKISSPRILKSHEYSADYLRSLVRRGSSRIDGIFKVTTKDGYTTRISIVVFARGRVKIAQQHTIRQIMREVIEEKAKTLTYDQLCHDIVLGSVAKAGIGSDIYNLAKKINPLRHVGVRKSKLLSIPEGPTEKVVLTQEAQTA